MAIHAPKKPPKKSYRIHPGPKEMEPTAQIPPPTQPCRCAKEDDIRVCAYLKWESAGKPPGDGVQFWLEAEETLVHEK